MLSNAASTFESQVWTRSPFSSIDINEKDDIMTQPTAMNAMFKANIPFSFLRTDSIIKSTK